MGSSTGSKKRMGEILMGMIVEPADQQQGATLLYRVSTVEKKIEALEKEMNQNNIVTTEIRMELKNLNTEFTNLKTEVVNSIKEQNDRVWGLIKAGLKIIIFLVIVITVFAGIKLGPEILKFVAYVGG